LCYQSVVESYFPVLLSGFAVLFLLFCQRIAFGLNSASLALENNAKMHNNNNCIFLAEDHKMKYDLELFACSLRFRIDTSV